MNENVVPFQSSMGQIAPLANIGVLENALGRLANRGPGDPGIIAVSGPSGYGKSVAAAFVKARHRVYYLQLDEFVTQKNLLQTLCRVLNIVHTNKKGETVPAKGTAAELAGKIATQLSVSRRVLVIDEFDFAVAKKLVMTVFSLYEMSKASIIIIGEENLPASLAHWEKFSGRILDTLYAEAIGLADARTLAKCKYPDFPFADDLLQYLVELAKGSVRRVNNNLNTIHNEALSMGWDHCDRAMWGNRKLQKSGVQRRDEEMQESAQ